MVETTVIRRDRSAGTGPTWLTPKGTQAKPLKSTYRNLKVAEKVGTPFRVYHFLRLKSWGQAKARP
jgi:hypothetical protein